MVLEQLLGQRDIPVADLSDSPPSSQGLQGPQQPLVLLDHLGQPVEKARGMVIPQCPSAYHSLGTHPVYLDYPNPHEPLGHPHRLPGVEDTRDLWEMKSGKQSLRLAHQYPQGCWGLTLISITFLGNGIFVSSWPRSVLENGL